MKLSAVIERGVQRLMILYRALVPVMPYTTMHLAVGNVENLQPDLLQLAFTGSVFWSTGSMDTALRHGEKSQDEAH